MVDQSSWRWLEGSEHCVPSGRGQYRIHRPTENPVGTEVQVAKVVTAHRDVDLASLMEAEPVQDVSDQF